MVLARPRRCAWGKTGRFRRCQHFIGFGLLSDRIIGKTVPVRLLLDIIHVRKKLVAVIAAWKRLRWHRNAQKRANRRPAF